MNKGFAVSDNRIEKAMKIEAVLQDFLRDPIKDKRILDLGAGSGEIGEYFSINNKVCSVDIEDQRKNKKSKVIFTKVDSEKLPFEDDCFDIVISNHVIEHIKNQGFHLNEIYRVLKKGGICYLATPNRYFPLETHYKIWFIHYLGNDKYNKYLKKKGIYHENIYLLNYFEMKKLFNRFVIREYTHKIIKDSVKFGLKIPIINRLPLFMLKTINFISRTNIFILIK
jgi:SAM-dependent methyltransferase